MGKLISKFCTWYMGRLQKKSQVINKQIQDKKLEDAGNNLKGLYEFVKFINEKALKNRHERKTFWRNVSNGQPLVETTLLNMLRQYGVKEASVKEIQDAKYRVEKQREAQSKLDEENKKKLIEK